MRCGVGLSEVVQWEHSRTFYNAKQELIWSDRHGKTKLVVLKQMLDSSNNAELQQKQLLLSFILRLVEVQSLNQCVRFILMLQLNLYHVL